MISLAERFPVKFCNSRGIDHELLSPNDHKGLSRIQYADATDIDHLLKLLPAGQQKMNSLRAFERARILRQVSSLIKEEAEAWALLISTEGGKPLKDARIEVDRSQVTLDLCAEEALRISGENLPMERTTAAINRVAFTYREAIGPVLAISAFNHPLNNIAHQLGCAIASGCAVVVKPAPATPLSAFKLEDFFLKAGLPDGCLFILNADIPEIEKIASASAISYVSFIGSAKVGWNLRKIIAPGTRLSLEHGGQAPAIIREDADLEQAVQALIRGAFYHAGQVCISTQRIFVHHSLFKNFLASFHKETLKLKIGDARSETTDVGPLIRSGEVTRISSWITEAIQQGARLVTGNEVSGSASQYLSPTILAHVPLTSKVMKDEIFGPVVCINPYEDEKELVNYLGQSEYVFEGCIFTRDISSAMKMARDLSLMTIVINDHNAYRVDWMPFGGHKLSGLGMGGVKYSVEEMTRLKQVIIKY
ncbi:MAG TPA: aldehyde dehydrogenase family protein [Bacteriovoracaceae bacterium]|nr:aldehyde dehydrogenase family protein [Bacteriovoracaceae bacterium]